MDVYHELLGIPPHEQPPNYYRLLGIALYESDRDVIVNATRRQCGFVRTVALVYPIESQQLLNELTQAKLVLLDPQRRKSYDQQLRTAAAGKVSPIESDGEIPKFVEGSSGSTGETTTDENSPFAGRRARLQELDESSEAFALVGQSWSFPPQHFEEEAHRPDAEWMVGSGSSAQIRVRAPWVSRKHCRIWRDRGEMFVEDLGSTNGTYVNGVPVKQPVTVHKEDVITLGKKTRIPWPLPDEVEKMDMRIFSIGRASDNDYVIDDKSVSQHHAQLVVQGGSVFLEDLDSRNGTRVGLLDNRIRRCELEPHLSVYFGRTKVFARKLLEVAKKLS